MTKRAFHRTPITITASDIVSSLLFRDGHEHSSVAIGKGRQARAKQALRVLVDAGVVVEVGPCATFGATNPKAKTVRLVKFPVNRSVSAIWEMLMANGIG